MAVTDDFNRANEALDAGANWSDASDFGWGSPGIISNQVLCAGGTGYAEYDGTTFNAAHYAQVLVALAVNLSNNEAGACVRSTQNGGVSTCYAAGYRHNSHGLDRLIWDWNDGSVADIATEAADIATSDVVRLEINGTSLSMKIGGVEELTGSDASYSSGRPGLIVSATSIVDDFEGGDLVAAAAQQPFRFNYQPYLAQ